MTTCPNGTTYIANSITNNGITTTYYICIICKTGCISCTNMTNTCIECSTGLIIGSNGTC